LRLAVQKTKNIILSGLLVLIFLFTAPFYGYTCTLWGAAGEFVEDGGVLIIKNRDWTPGHNSQLIFLRPLHGFSFLSLFSTGGNSLGVKAGINEKGLVVITATASSLPREKRIVGDDGLMTWLLIHCDSVDSVLEEEELISESSSGFFMVADKNRIALIEVAPEGNYSVEETDDGVLYHTNHYLNEDLLVYNEEEKESSLKRLERIKFLLEEHEDPFTEEDFIEFSQDRSDGPDNSIWRDGSSDEITRTVGTWLVYLPEDGPPELHVRIVNTDEGDKTYELKLDEDFWEEGKLELD